MTTKNTEFKHHGHEFTLTHIHSDSYRLIDQITRTWTIVRGNSPNLAFRVAKKLIGEVFCEGRPNFFPRGNDKFVITDTRWDSETNSTEANQGLSFRTGTHSQNAHGTGRVTAAPGTIITFDAEGEEYGFWYLDQDKEPHPQYSWKYSDGTERQRRRGSKPWVLLWNKKIKGAKENDLGLI